MVSQREKPDIIFILSVDAEEEWDWDGEFPQSDFAVSNLKKVPQFQDFCHRNGIRPTYFVDYAAAENPEAADTLKDAAQRGHCEIGAHLHPWSNPPYFGITHEKESHVVNLPIEQVEEKLNELMAILHKNLQTVPTSFRTGRWGINSEVMQLLVKKGFRVDSSVYPYYRNDFFNCDDVEPAPYWPDLTSPHEKGSQRDLVEFPVTVGFNRKNYSLMDKVHRMLSTPALLPLRLIGILWQTHLLRKLYLSPEVISSEDMLPLIDSSISNNYPVIHMYFHSSSLIEGTTGFMKETRALETICNNIQQAVEHTKTRANVRFCTISEAANILQHRCTYL